MKQQTNLYNTIYLSLVIIVCLSLTGCGGDDIPTGQTPPEEPTTGAVEVTTSTNGPDQDDSYTITTDGAGGVAIGASEIIIITALDEGVHDLELTDTAVNCSVEGDNPQSVNITAGDTTMVSFVVSCLEQLKNQIVFYSERDHPNGELYLTNPDGTNQLRLTNNASGEQYADISPDGTQIAFTNTADRNIYVINADGTNPQPLTSSGEDFLPNWSSDGTQIAFTSMRDGDSEIYLMNADGTNQTNLTNSPGSNEEGGSWSADGQRIAFNSNRDGNYEIFTINTEGTGLQKLTNNSDSDLLPEYSPDGTQISFYSNRDGNREVYVMNSDGSNQQRVTDNDSNDLFQGWSPDGNQLVFHSDRDGNIEVYVINVDGSGLINLTVNASNDALPDWSPVQ